MSHHKINLLPSAQEDIQDSIDSFRKMSIEAADKFSDSIDQTIERLEKFPLSSPLSNDNRLHRAGYRVAVLAYDYLMFYKVEDDIYIYRVINGKRNYGSII